MKKYLFLLLLLLVSFTLTPFSYEINASSENEVTIKTFYPTGVFDYADLTNIKSFSIGNDNIVYTLNGQELNIIDKTPHPNKKPPHIISGFTNIKLIKYVNNNYLIVDNNVIYILNDFSKNNANQLSILLDNLPNYTAIDIYSNTLKTYIGYTYNNTFKLLEFAKINTNTTADTIKTFTSDYYSNAYLLALNNNNAYICYNINISQNGICIQNYNNNIPTNKETLVSYSLIDTFYLGSQEYVVTFTNEVLRLLNNNLQQFDEVVIGTETTSFPIRSLSNFDFYNNVLYVSDIYYKTIQNFTITNNTLDSDTILLCGNNEAKGRFNNVDNIFIQGDTIYTSDTGNNRLQILTPEETIVINMPENYSTPTSINRDSYNILYTTTKFNDQYRILKYQYNYNYEENSTDNSTEKNNYILDKYISFSKQNAQISNTTLVNNTLYALDHYNNEVVYVNGDTTSYKFIITDNDKKIVDIKENSKLIYNAKNNVFALLNNNVILLVDTNGVILDQISFDNTNIKDITLGLNEIYVLTDNNTINLINIYNNEISLSNKQLADEEISQLTSITYDIIENQIYGFNNIKSCIVYFDSNLVNNPFTFNDFTTEEKTTIYDMPYIYELRYNTLIYTHPYNLGDYYITMNNYGDVKYVVAVESYDDYLRILFEKDSKLVEGFVYKEYATKLEYTYSVIKVTTVNELVPVYKYPTILKYNDKPITCDVLPIYRKVTLTHVCPQTIDGKTFYMFQENGKVGFLYSKDIVRDSSQNITSLNIENAKINSFDKTKINMLSEDKNSIVCILDNNSRIYVENYDKDSKYTKVVYKDNTSKVYEGYVETKYIEMDKLDLSKIILISLIIVSIIILIVILSIYISIKKKK